MVGRWFVEWVNSLTNEEEKSYYKITEILEIEPTDLSVLLPKDNKTELTLITCKEGAASRVMVKSEKQSL